MDTMFGKVSHIGIRSSTIRTFDGAEVIAPNDDLIRREGRQLDPRPISNGESPCPSGVAYGTDPNEVLGILRRLAAEHERVSQESRSRSRSFAVSARARSTSSCAYFVDASDILEVPSELCVAVAKAFAEAGIEIAFPQRDLHVRSVPEGLMPAAARSSTEE